MSLGVRNWSTHIHTYICIHICTYAHTFIHSENIGALCAWIECRSRWAFAFGGKWASREDKSTGHLGLEDKGCQSGEKCGKSDETAV